MTRDSIEGPLSVSVIKNVDFLNPILKLNCLSQSSSL